MPLACLFRSQWWWIFAITHPRCITFSRNHSQRYQEADLDTPGYYVQSRLQERYDKPPGSEADNLWSIKELGASRFQPGLRFSNHFEVVENTGREIYVRCGGSPMTAPGLRDSDGLIVLGARIDRAAQQAEFTFKTALYSSGGTFAEGAPHPIPPKIEVLHRWYVRILTQAAVGRVKA